MQPGLYPGLSWEQYRQIEAVNGSTLKLFANSPAHAFQEIVHPSESTPPMLLGTAVHCAVLEPEDFAQRYVPGIKVDRRTNKGKREWADFLDACRGREVLKADDYELCTAISRACWTHPIARGLLSGEGENELAAVWGPDNRPCKARIDRLTTRDGGDVVIDLKTTQDASRYKFGKDSHTYGYHVSAAFTLDGLASLRALHTSNSARPAMTKAARFLLIAAEKYPPFAVAVYELSQAALDLGRIEYKRYLEQFTTCCATSVWPSYENEEITELELPAYAYNSVEILEG